MTTLVAPGGAFGGSNGAQSGTESRISTLIVPLNGWLISASLPPEGVSLGPEHGRPGARPYELEVPPSLHITPQGMSDIAARAWACSAEGQLPTSRPLSSTAWWNWSRSVARANMDRAGRAGLPPRPT